MENFIYTKRLMTHQGHRRLKEVVMTNENFRQKRI